MLGRELSDEEVVAHWGHRLRERFARIAGLTDRVEELVNVYVAHYEAHHDAMASLFPGIPEMLADLSRLGCRMGVVTSKHRRYALLSIERFDLVHFIRVIVGADDVTRRKPEPEPVLEALRRLGGRTEESLMVGDGVFDIQAARAAGVRSVAALWGTREVKALLAAGPHFVARTPQDIVALVESA